MSEDDQLQLAAVESLLVTRGGFCPLDYLLESASLTWPDYQAWRDAPGMPLVEAPSLAGLALSDLLATAEAHCRALGLEPRRQLYFPWGGERSQPLLICADEGLAARFCQRWERPAAPTQPDLFMDNGAAIAEHALVDELGGREFSRAGRTLARLTALNPQHPALGGYQDLINYAAHLQAQPLVDDAELDEEWQALRGEVEPLARELLGGRARDYLALAWQRLATALEERGGFAPEAAERHYSFALARIPDWQTLRARLLADDDTWQHPVLMERLLRACDALGERERWLLLWCLFLERAPDAAARALQRERDGTLRALWERCQDLAVPSPANDFPALLLASYPGLIHHLALIPPLRGEASLAMLDLLQCRLAGRDEIAARSRLQAASPALLAHYLDRLRP